MIHGSSTVAAALVPEATVVPSVTNITESFQPAKGDIKLRSVRMCGSFETM